MLAFIFQEPLSFFLALAACLLIGFAVTQTRIIVSPQESSWAVPITVIMAALFAGYLGYNIGDNRLEDIIMTGEAQGAIEVTLALLMHPALIVPVLVGLFIGVRVEQGFATMVFYPLLAALTVVATTFAYAYSLAHQLWTP